jgi:endonuclease/exonuclease/phosphatase family metal-dependent hydrolase
MNSHMNASHRTPRSRTEYGQGPCARPGDYSSMITPDRIDFIFAKGSSIRVEGSHIVDERLKRHEPGPFYSDHAAVVTDLSIG